VGTSLAPLAVAFQVIEQAYRAFPGVVSSVA